MITKIVNIFKSLNNIVWALFFCLAALTLHVINSEIEENNRLDSIESKIRSIEDTVRRLGR